MMGDGRLGEVEERHKLADADLPGVLAQDVNELHPHRVAQRLGDLCHADSLLALPHRGRRRARSMAHLRVASASGSSSRLTAIYLRISIEVIVVNGYASACRCRPRHCPAACWPSSLGSAFLAAVVVGSGIAAQQLSPGAVGLELLENAVVTGAGLYVLISILGPALRRRTSTQLSRSLRRVCGTLSWRDALIYVPAQVLGCVVGAVAANGMFGKAAVSIAQHHRASPGAPVG